MKPLHLLLLALSCVVGDLLAAAGTAPRTHVLIVGSSTAYPIIATVAERLTSSVL